RVGAATIYRMALVPCAGAVHRPEPSPVMAPEESSSDRARGAFLARAAAGSIWVRQKPYGGGASLPSRCTPNGVFMRTLIAILGFGLMLLDGYAGAQVILYDHEGLRGHVFSVNSPITSLADYGFNDRASSAVVERGEWEVCEHAYFRGECVVLRSGQYPSLAS